jgi:hypothetical protein
MDYFLHKDKIGKGHTWPIKRTMLDAALTKYKIHDVATVSYVRVAQNVLKSKSTDRVIIQATYTSDHDKFHPGKFHIYIYSIPYDDRIQIRQLATLNVLPRVMRWLKESQSKNPTWKDQDHECDFCCEISSDQVGRLNLMNSVSYV